MTIKKYIGSTLSEAIEIAKINLGNDIEIIEKKEVRKPGLLGMMSKKDVEISVIKKNNDSELKKEIEILKNIISNLEGNKSNNDIEKICKKLKKIYIKDEIIEDIKQTLPKMKNEEMSNNLVDYLRDKIEVNNNCTNSNLILVGPPGVGKTTTIAKIAADLVFKENKKVGVLTIDTYRIGAVEQLKIYAEIMNIKFKSVLSPDEISKAIEEMSDCDIVLIDTTGRGCKNSMQISELKNYIKSSKSDNIHLVLGITTKDSDLEAIIDSYNNINFNNIIITKLDETTTYGSILNIATYAKKPISYITTGQNVPNDIIKPSKDKLIKILLGVETI